MSTRRAVPTFVAFALVIASVGIHATDATAAPRDSSLPALHAVRGAKPAIVDANDRQVILRGVNLNSLGDYYQDNQKLPPVVPVTEKDWASMASHGFDVVRLLISWSKLEPSRGHYDRAYLAQIRRAVDAARRHDMYTVIDMHQDAWGKYIASPKGVTCPTGRTPAIGWDGAPKWATITDGASTCTAGSREDSEAVLTAWDSFYANRDGIMDELVNAWGRVAREFRTDASVAGYDLINEPNHGHHDDTFKAALGTYYARAIQAIRAEEKGPRAVSHIVFFETTVFGVPVETGFSDDPNLVLAPHHYGESIGDINIEGLFDYYQNLANDFQTPLWIGEYGWFSEPNVAKAKLERYAAKEDSLITAGDAWWQWRQACGDPHSIGKPGGKPARVQIHFQENRCPGDHNQGVIPQWACTGRPYPRATPGRITALASKCERRLTMSATTSEPGSLDIWFPGRARPNVRGPGVSRVHASRVSGGWRITARVSGSYTVVGNSS